MRPPPGPATAPGREGDTRGPRKRGRRLAPGPGEVGGCGPEVRGREESRHKRRMVAWMSGKEEVESDRLGEVSRAGRTTRRRAEGLGGRGDLADCRSIEAVKEAELPVQPGRHSKEVLAFALQPAPSLF
jgi:hypothetical protein